MLIQSMMRVKRRSYHRNSRGAAYFILA